MKEISLDNLQKFEDIFNEDREKHMVILLTIKTFVYRFEKFPELRNKAKLFALSDDWMNDGYFFMIFVVWNEHFVFFDSIHDSTDVLKNALRSLDYNNLILLFAVRNVFHNMICELRDELGIKMHVDADTACFHLPMAESLALEYEVPPNFHVKELTEENVEQINSIWPHRSEGSESFVSYSIKYHLNVGVYDDDNNLAAWCLRYDNGALGVLQTDPKYLRKGLGSVAVKSFSKKIAEEFQCDNIALVVHGNEKSMNLFTKLGFKNLGSHTWYNLIKE
ncbi:uncharacterized protein [Chironomus tepperi]|uniref:uncharacterized protein n=1 Tax=Chironomus tepperi TaxID=113505 RepID=UPI00391F7C6D